MKILSLKNIIIAASSLILLQFELGCKKLLDINQDPTVPGLEQGNSKLLFPAAVIGTVARTGGDLAILGAIWGQYGTQSALSSQYRQLDAYNLDGSQLNGPYGGMFASGTKNFQAIIDISKVSRDWNFYLMATTMKAYTLALLVDIYDQIPYTESLGGQTNLNPKFDDGQAIYKNLLTNLDSALSKDFTANTNTSPGKVDLLFPGVGATDVETEINWLDSKNLDRWKEFANTLKLKMYLRMVNTNAALAESSIKKLYADNAAFLTTDADVSGFKNEEGKDNPMYEQNIRKLNTPDNIRASRTMASFLIDKKDTRISYIYGSAAPTSIHQGDFSNNDASFGYGSAAKIAQRAEDPVVLISAAESYLLQAEARERYFEGAGAKALYDLGVKASFTSMDANGTAFLAAGGVYEYNPAGTLAQKIEAISTQKWISFAHGVHYIEGFLEKNRTGYPKSSAVYSTDANYVFGQFVVSKNSVLPPGQFPKRLVFPDVEKNRNNKTPTLVPITTKVWWAL